MSDYSGSIFQVTAVDADHAWAVTHAGLLRTQDGGATWSLVGPEVSSAARIQFLDASNGWAVTADKVLATSDGGETWALNTAIPPTPKFWHTLSFISMSTGWVADWDGALYRTTDGGASWTALDLPAGGIPKLKLISAQSGWASLHSAAGATIYTTGDGGATWQERITLPSGAHVDALDAVDMDRAWGTVRNHSEPAPAVIRTTDGGATWTSTGVAGAELLLGFQFVGADAGWVADAGGVYASSNGGAAWTADAPPDLGDFVYETYSDVAFVDGSTGWVVGSVAQTLSNPRGFILKRN